ncbi:hypothetical protein [Luteimonas deserti]|uniref:hypothetical protein n=1 Tax=Luteimonas deserti TaxID=2752306 RepID=UPI001F37DBFF|nr:hypothetical protein [Luteimonas deserti]
MPVSIQDARRGGDLLPSFEHPPASTPFRAAARSTCAVARPAQCGLGAPCRCASSRPISLRADGHTQLTIDAEVRDGMDVATERAHVRCARRGLRPAARRPARLLLLHRDARLTGGGQGAA